MRALLWAGLCHDGTHSPFRQVVKSHTVGRLFGLEGDNPSPEMSLHPKAAASRSNCSVLVKSVTPKYLGGPPVDRNRLNAHPWFKVSDYVRTRDLKKRINGYNFMIFRVT
ncbi:hypothetical protein TNCV_4814121 [Trichonephila clavipes]|nr:hypothetical protein TNCV_4814121 [Trichonephila clavipes]